MQVITPFKLSLIVVLWAIHTNTYFQHQTTGFIKYLLSILLKNHTLHEPFLADLLDSLRMYPLGDTQLTWDAILLANVSVMLSSIQLKYSL